MIEHITFGIIIDDIVFPEGETQMGVLGGGGPQTAWGMAAALGSGETVGLVAGIGGDLEPNVLGPMRNAGVDLRGVRITDLPTPRAWQTLEEDGKRRQTWRVPMETIRPQLARNLDVLPPEYREARVFHWGVHLSESDWIEFARSLRQQGRLISLEPFRPPAETPSDEDLRAILAACDVFSPNWEELAGRRNGRLRRDFAAIPRARRAGARGPARGRRRGRVEPAGRARGARSGHRHDGCGCGRRGKRVLRGAGRPAA